jgi:hypothetical protein
VNAGRPASVASYAVDPIGAASRRLEARMASRLSGTENELQLLALRVSASREHHDDCGDELVPVGGGSSLCQRSKFA